MEADQWEREFNAIAPVVPGLLNWRETSRRGKDDERPMTVPTPSTPGSSLSLFLSLSRSRSRSRARALSLPLFLAYFLSHSLSLSVTRQEEGGKFGGGRERLER
jgi:hypothetical protein